MPRNLKEPLLELGLAHLPCAATQLVENRIGPFRTIARQKLDIFDRQEQPVIACIMDFKAIMRRTRRRDCLESNKTTDTMINVDDNVASRQRGDFRDEILIALAALGTAHKTVAENILLGHDDEIASVESAFNGQHSRRHLVA